MNLNFNRSPEPVEGRFSAVAQTLRRASTGSALRYQLKACSK
jgi:hypothetical protein